MRNTALTVGVVAFFALSLAACTQVPTEQVGGRKIVATTHDPANIPEGYTGPMLKEVEITSQTDVTAVDVERKPDGSFKVSVGSTLSSAAIAQAMADVAKIQIETQGRTVGEVLDSPTIAEIVKAVVGAGL